MNRSAMMKPARKSDARMPFDASVQNMLSGYLYPQLHKDLRQLPSAKKKKEQP